MYKEIALNLDVSAIQLTTRTASEWIQSENIASINWLIERNRILDKNIFIYLR